MDTIKIYTINKGINKPIEFRGVKAQYLGYLAAAVVGGMVAFAILYIAGVNPYLVAPFSLGLGGFLVSRVFHMCKKYGQYGLMKKRARRAVPKALVSNSRKLFNNLMCDYAGSIK